MEPVLRAGATRYDLTLQDLARRLHHLLALPPGIAIDPLRVTDPHSGKYIRDVVGEIAASIRTTLGIAMSSPDFAAWDTGDCGPGISRLQIREVLQEIDRFRSVLWARLDSRSL